MEVVPLHRARLDFLRLFKDIKITSPSTGVMLVVWPVGAVSAFPHRGTAFCRAPHTTCTHKYLYYLCVRTLYIYIFTRLACTFFFVFFFTVRYFASKDSIIKYHYQKTMYFRRSKIVFVRALPIGRDAHNSVQFGHHTPNHIHYMAIRLIKLVLWYG